MSDAIDRATIQLAKWLAIEHGETESEFENYIREAEELADLLWVIGYRLAGGKHE